MLTRQEQYQARRYGTVVEPASAPASPPPIRDLSYDELRRYGNTIDTKARSLAGIKADIERYKAKRSRDGPEYAAKWDAAIAEKEASKQLREEALAAYLRELRAQGVDVQAAYRAAPKRYRTDLENQGKYVPGEEPNLVAPPGAGYTGKGPDPGRRYGGLRVNVVPSQFSQRRFDASQRRDAAARPGIYRLSDGSAVVSTLEDGQYRGGTVKRPIASGLDGRPIYAKDPAPSMITGFDLNDAASRDSLRQNAGQFRTVGDMFGASQASYGTPAVPAHKREAILGSERGWLVRSVYRYSDFVSWHQGGFDKRQARLDRALSKVSFGGGTPYAQRSWFGKTAQVGAGILTSPIWGPAATGDAAVLGAEKVSLYGGALLSPELRRPAARELRNTLPVLKEVYTDPATYAYALTGGYAYGRYLSRPRSVSIRSGTGITAESFAPGTGMVRTKAVATYQYKAGPFGLYKWSKNAPAEGSLIYHSQPVAGNLWATRAESVASTRYGKRSIFLPEDWAGTYNPKTQVLALRNAKGGVYLSQEGRNVPAMSIPAMADPITMTQKSQSRFMVLQTNRRGVAKIERVGLSVGRTESYTYQKVRLAPLQTNYGSIDAFYGSPRYYARSVRGAKSFAASGGSTDLFSAGFGDLRKAGLWRDPRIEQRPMFRDQFGMFLRDRRGSLRGASAFEEVLSPKPTRQRNPFVGREPTFSGIPLGGSRFTSRGLYGIVPRYATRAGSGFSQRPDLRARQRPSTLPGLDTRPLIGSRVISGQRPRTITTPRYDLTPRSAVVPRETPFPVVPLIPLPRGPPITPPGLPGLGGGSMAGGYTAGKGTSRGYAYTPSLIAIAYRITGKERKGAFTGLEVRPILRPRRRRR